MSKEGSKQLFWSDSTYKLEYVDAGKFYVRTDFCPDSTCTFEAKFAYISSQSNRGDVVFGVRNGWLNGGFLFYLSRVTSSSDWLLQYGSYSRSTSNLSGRQLHQPYIVDFGRTASMALTLNGAKLDTATSAQSFQCDDPFCINCHWSDGSKVATTIVEEMRFYWCKVWRGNELKLDIVPVMDDKQIKLMNLVDGHKFEFVESSTPVGYVDPYLVAGPKA